MTVLTIKEPMLYCPKCQTTYKEGTQRFCSNEGARLVPAPNSGRPINNENQVFSGILNRIAPGGENKLTLPTNSKFVKNEPVNTNHSNFAAPLETKIFKTEPDLAEKIDEEETQKALPRVIKPSEIPSSQASLGDRKLNPAGRSALSWENPDALLGQTVKGRYVVTEKIGEDENSIAYLAEDKIADAKKVVVRVLMDEDQSDFFTRKIFAEERVSLSLLNHPNIARILDSGELLEGKPFIISEYTGGKSLADKLDSKANFSLLETLRIVRQIADALSEAHQNGVLHRDLKPENIILTAAGNSGGAEQVKLINFGNAVGGVSEEGIEFKSPEQLEGNRANYASDVFSLAVVAYRLLTGQMPFMGNSVDDLIEDMREGKIAGPTKLRTDLPSTIDLIIEKALSFDPSERYPKARDFGDAFSNALTKSLHTNTGAQVDNKDDVLEISPLEAADNGISAKALENIEVASAAISENGDRSGVLSENKKALKEISSQPLTPEALKNSRNNFVVSSILGIILLSATIWVVWAYFLNSPVQPGVVEAPAESVFPDVTTDDSKLPSSSPKDDSESTPLPRTIIQPPNTVYFQNRKENLKGDLAKNFLGFSLYYPEDWKENDAQGKFLDISKDASSGTPIEQMLISYYDSKGTFKMDTALFPSLVKETNSTLKEIVPNYEVVSEGETTVNNGWRAYEVKFKGSGKTANGENITLWGRRLFIPTARVGMKNGYVITMLATSLSPAVKNVDDVGVSGELAEVLKTFEPNQTF